MESTLVYVPVDLSPGVELLSAASADDVNVIQPMARLHMAFGVPKRVHSYMAMDAMNFRHFKYPLVTIPLEWWCRSHFLQQFVWLLIFNENLMMS